MVRIPSLAAGLALGLLCAAPSPATAGGDEAFFRSVVGEWSGPGEIVAGKYEGTRFVCSFNGSAHETRLGMALDGSCRVGIFSQEMSAEVFRTGQTYTGSFLDGADGEGLDIVSGNVNGDRIIVGLDRKQLEGAMVARLVDRNTMNITISVRVANELVPVIGMTLDRQPNPVAQSALNR